MIDSCDIEGSSDDGGDDDGSDGIAGTTQLQMTELRGGCDVCCRTPSDASDRRRPPAAADDDNDDEQKLRDDGETEEQTRARLLHRVEQLRRRVLVYIVAFAANLPLNAWALIVRSDPNSIDARVQVCACCCFPRPPSVFLLGGVGKISACCGGGAPQHALIFLPPPLPVDRRQPG